MSAKSSEQAIAYLKASLPDDGTPSVVLAFEDSPVVRPFADGVCVFYLMDAGKVWRYLTWGDLQRDGICGEELHRIGLRNLTETARRRGLRVQRYGNIFAVLMGGDLEAGIVLLDEFWGRHFRQFVSGDYAIAMPARDILAFCDSSSLPGRVDLSRLIARINPSGDHLISDKIWFRRNGQLSPQGAENENVR